MFPLGVAVVCHHGGAGTTQTAMQCSVPQLVLPFTYDQFAWRATVERAGMGVSPPRGREAHVGALRACLQILLTSWIAKHHRRPAQRTPSPGAAGMHASTAEQFWRVIRARSVPSAVSQKEWLARIHSLLATLERERD
jgi:UDP:flavonoid glycosyltransferase YjiC (YdhE family)